MDSRGASPNPETMIGPRIKVVRNGCYGKRCSDPGSYPTSWKTIEVF